MKCHFKVFMLEEISGIFKMKTKIIIKCLKNEGRIKGLK